MLSDIINKKLKGYLGQLSSTRLSLGQKQAFTQLLPLWPVAPRDLLVQGFELETWREQTPKPRAKCR
ncbi:hypothetical protein BDE02_12G115300 [Populus trichocarpa]|nr:hypothetical protein BDE02_12G115300 [Populus trichocarpa]